MKYLIAVAVFSALSVSPTLMAQGPAGACPYKYATCAPAPAAAPAQTPDQSQAQSQPQPQTPVGDKTIKGTVTFATMLPNGTMQPLAPEWAIKWAKKNEKKYPNVKFQTSGSRSAYGNNFLVVFSSSSSVLQGFQPVTHTQTSTNTSYVSGNGTVMANDGSMWNYDVSGTVDTTTTTTVHENAAYTQNTNILYVTAYDETGQMVAQQSHVYSTRQGGDASYSAGYNIGNALGAINARGRTLSWVVDRIEGRKN